MPPDDTELLDWVESHPNCKIINHNTCIGYSDCQWTVTDFDRDTDPAVYKGNTLREALTQAVSYY